MKVFEYRLVLPMTPEQYKRCQLYMVAKASLEDATKAEAEGAANDCMEILKNEEYTNEDGDTGQYTHKRINIANKLPGWLVSWVDPRLTVFDEKSWNAFPHLKTTYDCELFSKAKVSMISHHLPGVQTDDNALALDAAMLAQRKVVLIDIVNDPVASKAYVESEDPSRFHSKKAGIGPLRKDWMTNVPMIPDVPRSDAGLSSPREEKEEKREEITPQDKHARLHGRSRGKGDLFAASAAPAAETAHAENGRMRPQYPIMTCYKLFVLDFPYFGFMASKVENWITGAMRDVLLNYHRKAVCWMDEWYELSMADIRKMEEEVKLKLDAIRGQTPPPLLAPSAEGKGEAAPEASRAPQGPAGPSSEGEETRAGDGQGTGDSGWSPTSDDDGEADSEQDEPLDLQATLPFAVTVDALAPWSLDAPGIFPLSPNKAESRAGDSNSQVSPAVAPPRPDAGAPGAATAAPASASPAAEPPKETLLHSGFLYKLGDGIWNTTWNLRYVVLRGSRLQYFNDPRDARAKCVVDLEGAEITWTGEMRGRMHSFYVHPACKRSMHFCGETADASRQWMAWLQEAAQSSDHAPGERRRFSSFSCSHHFLPKSFSPSLASRGVYGRLGASSRTEQTAPPHLPPMEETRTSDGEASLALPPHASDSLVGSQQADAPERESGDTQATEERHSGDAGDERREAEGEGRVAPDDEGAGLSRHLSPGSVSGVGPHCRPGFCGRIAAGECEGVCDLLPSPEITPDLEYCVRRLKFLLSNRARPRFSPARNEDDVRVLVKDASQWISLPPPKAVHIRESLSRQTSSSRACPQGGEDGAEDEGGNERGEISQGERGDAEERGRRPPPRAPRGALESTEFSERSLRLQRVQALLGLVLPIVLPAFALYQCAVLCLQSLACLSEAASLLFFFFSSLSSLCASLLLLPFSSFQSASSPSSSLFSLSPLSATFCADAAEIPGDASSSFSACLLPAVHVFLKALLSHLLLFLLRVLLWILLPFFLGLRLASFSRLFSVDSPHPHRPPAALPRPSRTGNALSVSPVVSSQRGGATVDLSPPLSAAGRDLVVKASCVVDATAEELFFLLMDVEMMSSWMLAHTSSPRVVSESIHSDFLSLSFSPSLLLSSSPAATAEAFLAACSLFSQPAGHALCPGQVHRGGLAEKASVALSAARVGTSSPFACLLSGDISAGVASAGAALAGPLLAPLLRDRRLAWRRWWGQTQDGSFVIVFHSEKQLLSSCMRACEWHSCGAGQKMNGEKGEQRRAKTETWAATAGARERETEETDRKAGWAKKVAENVVSWTQRLASLLFSDSQEKREKRSRGSPTALHGLLRLLRHAFPIAVHPFSLFPGSQKEKNKAAETGDDSGETPWDTSADAVLASGFEAFVITPLSPSLEQLALPQGLASADCDARAASGAGTPRAAAGAPPCLLTFVSAVDWGGAMPRWLGERIALLRADRILRGAKLESEMRRARKRTVPADQDLLTEDLLETVDTPTSESGEDRQDELHSSPSSPSPSSFEAPSEAAGAALSGHGQGWRRQDAKEEDTAAREGPTRTRKRVPALPRDRHLPEALREFRRSPQGGLVALNLADIDAQRAVFLELIQRRGEAVREGRGLVDVSLPVSILQPKSLLAFLGNCWGFAPMCLSRAADVQTDVLERFKWTVTFAVASLHLGCCQRKPFNPLLGETFQGHWPDGTRVFLEQTAIDPPSTAFLVRSPKGRFSFWGNFAFRAELKGNYGVLRQEGETVVCFPHDETEIRFSQPTAKVCGLLWGPRVFEWGGKMDFKDERNSLYCRLQFGVATPTHSPTHVPSDFFYGEIKDAATGASRSVVTGSWIDQVNFDGMCYWDTRSFPAPAPLEACTDSEALPTDSRFRQDILYLSEGLIEEAQEWKLELEAVQRRDRAVRANGLALQQTAGVTASPA
ncbi:UNVERIFIED_CONTAM: phosphatidylinositol transfer protein [Hammondia hammondi]|eukprot:XP_008889127.1 phosphatidylinositol transfer protein [Hammondia hammondi]